MVGGFADSLRAAWALVSSFDARLAEIVSLSLGVSATACALAAAFGMAVGMARGDAERALLAVPAHPDARPRLHRLRVTGSVVELVVGPGEVRALLRRQQPHHLHPFFEHVQPFLDRAEVLDDAVVDERQHAVAADVRVRIFVGRRAVRRPARRSPRR